MIVELKALTRRFGGKLFGSRIYWDLYLGLYDHMVEYPPYVKMLSDVYDALEMDKYGNGVFLDVGCGTGNFIVFALSRNPRLRFIGFDLSKEGVGRAIDKMKKLGYEHQVSIVDYYFKGVLPYDDSMFDVSLP